MTAGEGKGLATTEKLALALEEAGAPQAMVDAARGGRYDDFLSESATPIHDLVWDADLHGLHGIADRAKNGDFDATAEESDAWANSAEGQATFARLMPGE